MALGEEVRKKLIVIAERISKKARVIAIVAYGSRVAGYYRDDSDYDIIIVLDKLRPRAKYSYGNDEGIYYSALLVDDRSFRKDCEESYLGEFVCGRLLNRYEVLLGEEYIDQYQAIYKRRIIIETVQELIEKYGPFADQLIFNAKYILFNKLKKRAQLYPPVAYSYIKTYSGSWGRDNEEFSKREIDAQCERLCSEGMLMKVRDGFMLTDKAEKMIKSYPLSSSLRLAKLGVRQYFTHGLAGRVGVDIAFKELFSKLGRAREKPEPPAELIDPRKELRIPEGKLIFGSDWFQASIEELGIKQGDNFKHSSQPIGEFFATTTKHIIEKDGKIFSFISKRYQDVWSLKWMIATIIALAARTFETRPMQRLANEYRGFLHLRMLGIRTPRVYAVAPEEKVMVREHIGGISLEDLIKSKGLNEEVLNYISLYGSALGKMHQSGFSMGDTKPTNVLCEAGSIAIIDLEQAEENGDAGWDIAEFIYYTASLLKHEEVIKMAENFVQGYIKQGDPGALGSAAMQKYILPFQAFVQPDSLMLARNVLLKAKSS